MDEKPTPAQIHKKLFNYGVVVLLILLGYLWAGKHEAPRSDKELGVMEKMTAPPQVRKPSND